MQQLWQKRRGQSYSLDFTTDASQEVLPTDIAILASIPERTKWEVNIPVGILKQGISGFQSIVKFLKENEGYTFSEISRITRRDQRTVWTAYNSVKYENRLVTHPKDVYISSSVIADRKFSVLEAITLELFSRGYSISRISEAIGRSRSTIGTVLYRIRRKGGLNA